MAALLVCLMLAPAILAAQAANPPLPPVAQLMREVEAHQKQLEKVRENYTFDSLLTTQDIGANGRVTKTESVESQDFFVNGHLIERTVKKNGQPLSAHDRQKEADRVTKLVEKAEKTPPGQPIQGVAVTVSRLLQIMDVSNPRREIFRGRPTIVFNFQGRKHVKTHGLAEDASKKIRGAVWIDAADLQVAHLEVTFDGNFRIAGGLLANIEKGSSFSFDQAPVSHPSGEDLSPGAPVADGLWLPTGAEGAVQARLLLLKNLRQHYIERDFDFQRFHVETQQSKHAKTVPEK